MTDPSASAHDPVPEGFTAHEREAIRQRAEELRAEGRSGKKKADLERAALDAIAAMPDADRALAERIHAIVTRVAPELTAKTWYGFPAYARDEGVVCFFTSAEKGEARYAVLGFNDIAQLDDGDMWPTAYAIVDWSPTVEQRVAQLIGRAVGIAD